MKSNLLAAALVLLFALCLAGCTIGEDVLSGNPGGQAVSDAAAEEIPVWKFCHGKREGLETAVIKGYVSDCEAGPREIEMTPEETEDIRDIAINGVITGKANDLSLTGGTWFYSFETPEGEYLLTVEMYKGWIVNSATGMYTFSR